MVAVTGANGLLGSFIVRKLIAEGRPFVALRRVGSDTSLLDDVKDRVTWREADVLDPVQLEEAFDGVTEVIHAAAIVSYNPRLAEKMLDINVLGTRHVVNECMAKNISRLVHISSVAALGRQKHQKVIDETNQWTEGPMNSTYAKSKYLAELEVFRGQEEGLNTVIVNPSVILAPADWSRSSAQLFRYVWNEKQFYVDGSLNYVDVRDVADITYRLMDRKDISGQRFVVSAGKIPFRDFFSRVAQVFQKKAPYRKLNGGILRFLAFLEESRSRIAGTEPLLTRETARLSGTDFFFDNKKISKTLSVDFQPIDTSIQWCCGYYRQKYAHKN